MEVKPPRPSSVPAGFKQTMVGVFPADWEIAQLGTLADVEGGYAFSSKAFLASGTYQVVKMSNLYGGSLDLERGASFLNELTEQERHYLLRPNHIILTLTGTTGKRDYGYSYMVTHEQNLLLNQRVARVVVPENSCARYVSLQLQSPCFLNQFFEVSKGGTGNQTNVGTQDVAAMRIPIPPLPEQRAIATALSDVDGLLGGLDRLIAKKRDLKQAAMQQLLTGQIRLPGFKGEWEVKRLGDVVQIKNGQLITSSTLLPGDIPVIAGGKQPAYFHAYANRFGRTVTISASGASAGYIALYDEPIFASDCTTISESKNYCLDFVFYQLLCKQQMIYKEQTGGAQPHIHAKDLNPILFSLPPLPEQTAIAAVLTDMDNELAALEQRREKTSALKQAMMQELLTGKTRLV